MAVDRNAILACGEGSEKGHVVGEGQNRAGIRCFVSHKCRTPEGKDHPHHEFIAHSLGTVFQGFGIQVINDPFRTGDDVRVRIETVEYDAFLFLSCEETWKSKACQHEMKVAKRRRVPIFVVRWSGEIPETHRKRIYVDWTDKSGTDMDQSLSELAEGIAVRGRLHRVIDAISKPDVSAKEQRELAEEVYEEEDLTAVAEFLNHLDKVRDRIFDAEARNWIAMAVAKTGHPRARGVLLRWLTKETHPRVQNSIREALGVRENPGEPTRNSG